MVGAVTYFAALNSLSFSNNSSSCLRLEQGFKLTNQSLTTLKSNYTLANGANEQSEICVVSSGGNFLK
jgi:hypothetical protein